MKRLPSVTLRYALRALFVCLLFGPLTRQEAQTRRPPRVLTRQTDTVYAERFSPDARTLAIARGAADAGRVELWDVETGTLRHIISGFDGPVWSVSFAPDGASLVTASVEFHARGMPEKIVRREGRKSTAELKWWDPQTGELKHQVTLPGTTQAGLMAFHSPDGKLLATIEYHWSFGWTPLCQADLKLRDAHTGELRVKLKADLTAFELPSFRSSFGSFQQFEPFFVQSNLRRQRVAFSPGGLLAFWNLNEVRLWNITTGEEVLKLNDFKHGLRAVAFAPVGETLAIAITTSADKKKNPTISSDIRLYDPATGAVTQTLPARTQSISCLTFAPNGHQMVVGGWQGGPDQPVATLELFDIQTGSRADLKTGDNGSVSTLALSPNGERLTFQTDVSSVSLVDTRTWTLTRTFDENSDGGVSPKSVSRFLVSVKSVLAVAFSANGKTVTGEIEQGGIKQWDPRSGEVKKQLGEHDEAGVVDISTNGATVAEVADDQSVRLWDVVSGDEKTVPASGGPITALALSPDGQTVAIGRAENVLLLNSATREQLRTLAGHRANIKSLAFSTDGRTLATASVDGAIQIWDLTSGQVTKTIAAGGKITTLCFAPTHSILASASEDGSVSLWDLQTGALALQLKKHSAAVNAIAFSTAGDMMATGGDDRTVIIWEIASGKARRTLKGQDLTVTSLAFSPDGTLLASGGGNASVVLWDVRTGELNRVLK
jgi:WD40 repeat protein